MSTAAPAATEAPKIEIPSLAALTGKPDAPEIPVATQIDPPVLEDDAKPTIPTDIFADTKPKKTDAQFAEERRQKKQARVQEEVERATSEWQQKYETEMTQRLEIEKRLQSLENEKKRFEEENGQFKSLAEQRAAELEDIRRNYLQTANSVVSPHDDPDFLAANDNLTRTLLATMPDFIQTADGTKAVTFEHIAQDPGKMGQIEQAIAIYADARQKGDQTSIDRAVSYVGMLLGADVQLGKNPEEDRLLERGSDDYRAINAALKSATPHVQAKFGRLQAIERDRPALVRRKLEQKTSTIRGMLSEQVFLSDDQIKSTLESDPTEGVAIIAAMAARVPAIKERLEAAVSGLSGTFASVQDGFILPPPASNDPAAIKAHQEQSRALHAQIGRAMRNAAAFEAVGPILAQVISERDAALSRLEQHARNANPGSTTERGGDGGALVQIPTNMFEVPGT